MAGKVIVRAPLDNMGLLSKMTVIIDGVKMGSFKKGEVAEFEITRDSEVYASILGVNTSTRIYALASDITELAVSFKKGLLAGTWEIAVVKKTPVNGNNSQTNASASVSVADELKKYKELLDMGIITQEEFDAKKKQLLDL